MLKRIFTLDSYQLQSWFDLSSFVSVSQWYHRGFGPNGLKRSKDYTTVVNAYWR